MALNCTNYQATYTPRDAEYIKCMSRVVADTTASVKAQEEKAAELSATDQKIQGLEAAIKNLTTTNEGLQARLDELAGQPPIINEEQAAQLMALSNNFDSRSFTIGQRMMLPEIARVNASIAQCITEQALEEKLGEFRADFVAVVAPMQQALIANGLLQIKG